MARKADSYRSSARNKARSDGGVEWLGVPTKRVRSVKWSKTYQPNGERERARRAKRLRACEARP
jgi:hypothetical protein